MSRLTPAMVALSMTAGVSGVQAWGSAAWARTSPTARTGRRRQGSIAGTVRGWGGCGEAAARVGRGRPPALFYMAPPQPRGAYLTAGLFAQA